MNKKTIIIISAVVVVAAIVGVAAKTVTNKNVNANAIQTAQVTSMEKADVVDATGEFEVHPYAELMWGTSGIIDSINVKAGDKVKADQELMTLEKTSVNASIISAQAELIKARQSMDDLLNSDTARATAWIALREASETLDDAKEYRETLDNEVKYQLVKIVTKMTPSGPKKMPSIHTYKNVADAETINTAQADLELAQAKYDDALRAYEKIQNGASQDDLSIAQAKIDSAQATVNSLKIIAPFDGEVLYVDATAGEVVNTGKVAIIVADTNHYFVEAQIDEADIALVQVDQAVTVSSDGLPGVELTGKIWSINPVGVTTSGLVKYIVQIALDPTDSTILLGSTANVKVMVSGKTSRLLVPLAAIKNGKDGEYVEVMRSNVSQQVPVVTGNLEGENVVVNGDLQVGDEVVISYETNISLPGFGAQK